MFDEGDNIGGLESSAAQGNLIEELADGDFVVIGGCIFEGEDQNLFDDGLQKEAADALDGLDEALAVELGRIQQFGFAGDGVGGIGQDVGLYAGSATARRLKECPYLLR